MYYAEMIMTSRFLRWSGFISAGTVAVLAAAVSGAWYHGGSLRMAAALVGIRFSFPQVKQLSTAQLSAWRADPGRAPPLLLDVREPAEFAVSHLVDARSVPWESESAWQTLLKEVPRTQPIVVYCSIGYRSAILARKLQRAGFIQVANLEGSIFKWASEGRSLIGPDARAATLVHPYDAEWSRLLAPDLRAPLP